MITANLQGSPRSESYPASGSYPSYYLLRAIRLYSLHGECNSNNSADELSRLHSGIVFNDEIWRNVSKILGSPGLRRLTFHVLEAEAVTLLIARVSLGLSLGSAVRYLEDLTSFGVIRPAVKLLRPAGVRGGRRVVVYAVPDAVSQQVEAVCKVHRRLENPLYLRELEIAEGILLDPVLRGGDVSYGAVVEAVKGAGISSGVPVMAEGVVRILLERGVRVWR